MSFVEIYNEAIQDLLNLQQPPAGPSTNNLLNLRLNNLRDASRQNNTGSPAPGSVDSSEGGASSVASDTGSTTGSGIISIRENNKGEISLEGASEIIVSTVDEVAFVLEQGNAVRATAAHKLNQNSSRSHAILTLTLEQRARPNAAKQLAPELRYLRSKLHLVDLAGSERAKETGTTGGDSCTQLSSLKTLISVSAFRLP